MTPEVARGSILLSDVPPRLDGLAWSRWHWRVIIALGITWVLDGLEASLVANLGPTLRDPRALGLTATEVGLSSSAYLLGQVAGALFFGQLTDRLGRKRLFLVTLGLYLIATALSGAAPSFAVFAALRVLAGAGIGGEYSAINSAIDELVPARRRGQIDLAINGSYWLGVAGGAVLTLAALRLPPNIGWRLCFGLGAILGSVILIVRRNVPESPRWLLMHGQVRAANQVMNNIEAEVYGHSTAPAAVPITVSGSADWRTLWNVLMHQHRTRTILAATLMIAQTFFYNAIFFSYGLILERFDGVPAAEVGRYVIPFAAGNFLGPLLLGPLFDRWGRRRMLALTYGCSAVLLTLTGALMLSGRLNAGSQTLAWCIVFFFASSAASAAYLTVSELFPVAMRGMAIAIFYALATLVGAIAPTLFGAIVERGGRWPLFWAYALAATLMAIAAAVAWWLGVNAEGRSLEALSHNIRLEESTRPE